jgi:hypothetical protein
MRLASYRAALLRYASGSTPTGHHLPFSEPGEPRTQKPGFHNLRGRGGTRTLDLQAYEAGVMAASLPCSRRSRASRP